MEVTENLELTYVEHHQQHSMPAPETAYTIDGLGYSGATNDNR